MVEMKIQLESWEHVLASAVVIQELQPANWKKYVFCRKKIWRGVWNLVWPYSEFSYLSESAESLKLNKEAKCKPFSKVFDVKNRKREEENIQ